MSIVTFTTGNATDWLVSVTSLILIVIIGSDTPQMSDLITHVVPCLHNDWENFGYQLLNDKDATRVITAIKGNITGDVESSAKSLLKNWLQLGYDTTWNKVIKCLKVVHLNVYAENIRKMLLSGNYNAFTCMLYVLYIYH